jgi:hypothetical protein
MMARVTAAMKLRNQSKDTFRKQNGYSWDYVIVLNVYKHDQKLSKMQDKFSFKKILLQLTNGGFQTKVFFSAQCDEVYIKIRAPIARLEQEADRIDMKLKLDPIRLAATCKEGKLVDGEVRLVLSACLSACLPVLHLCCVVLGCGVMSRYETTK